ncbi:MAG: SurA N-terminal domain-containing protein [Desulfobacteraceae bacterium]|nr:SurA N-terminal domain-containing protein [Desulfobacteraceae bacterium]
MIKNNLFILFYWIGSILLCILSTGCEQKTSDYGNEVLLRVGERALTVHGFNEAFEFSKTAYAHNIRQQSEALREAQIRLLNQLTVEMLILERGQELGISVSDDELEQAVSRIKSDYPEGEFEETLIEFSVSYDAWLNRLKTRLALDKVVEAELKNRISISPEDISQYYKKNFQVKELESDSTQSAEDINEAIVKQLRREKSEQAYKTWIEELKTQYAININSEQWDEITLPRSINDNEADSGKSKSD